MGRFLMEERQGLPDLGISILLILVVLIVLVLLVILPIQRSTRENAS